MSTLCCHAPRTLAAGEFRAEIKAPVRPRGWLKSLRSRFAGPGARAGDLNDRLLTDIGLSRADIAALSL